MLLGYLLLSLGVTILSPAISVPLSENHFIVWLQEWNSDGRYRDVEDVLRSAAYDRDSVELVGRALAKIIAGPSMSQVSLNQINS